MYTAIVRQSFAKLLLAAVPASVLAAVPASVLASMHMLMLSMLEACAHKSKANPPQTPPLL